MAACAIYLHMVAFGAVLISGFWSLMAESFDSRSAKESFGRIGGMGTVGGLCGGLLAERVAAWFGAREVVLLLAALHLACAGLTWRVARFAGRRPQEQVRAHQRHRCGATLPVSAYVNRPRRAGIDWGGAARFRLQGAGYAQRSGTARRCSGFSASTIREPAC